MMKMKGIYSKRTKQTVGAITLAALLLAGVAMLPKQAHSDDVITEDAAWLMLLLVIWFGILNLGIIQGSLRNINNPLSRNSL
jgi:hypothetical protein